MEKILSVESMRECDKHMIENIGIPSHVLMQSAASSIADEIAERNFLDKKIIIIVGSGNNGGDGLALAIILNDLGYDVALHILTKELSKDSEFFFKYIGGIKQEKDLTKITEYDIIVDAIFGTGLNRMLDSYFVDIIDKINGANKYVIAVDIPSGLNGNNGLIMGNVVKADLTVTFAAKKYGHLLNFGKDYCGEIVVKDIGIFVNSDADEIADKEIVKKLFSKRMNNTHKGTYKKSLAFAGSSNYFGAGILCESAMRAGVGYAVLACPDSLKGHYAERITESILMPQRDKAGVFVFNEKRVKPALEAESIVLGMGMTKCQDVKKLVEYLINNYDKNLIIDADGLNSIDMGVLTNKRKDGLKILITPHIKEFSRLTGIPVEEIQKNPTVIAKNFAKEFNVFVLLKGTSTIVTDGRIAYFLDNGSPALAKAGSGDVLSGLIAGISAKTDELFESAICGAFLHNECACFCAKEFTEHTVLARDLVNSFPYVLKSILT